MSDEAIHVEPQGDGVVVLRLDRPPVNALSPAFLGLLRERIDALAADANVRAVVVTGAGKVLSGGMDLKEIQAFTTADQIAMVEALNRVFAAFYAFPKPVICAANGAAIAGGLFFVLVADFRLAGNRATFGLAEVRAGVHFPVGPQEIARNELAPAALRRLAFSGNAVDAETAAALGVVDEVVALEGLMDRAFAVARDYAAIPPGTFAAVKAQFRKPALDAIARAMETGADPTMQGWFTEETMDAVRAILAARAK